MLLSTFPRVSKVDVSLLPGLKEQLKGVISDGEQLNGLANMLASLPAEDRKGALEKVSGR